MEPTTPPGPVLGGLITGDRIWEIDRELNPTTTQVEAGMLVVSSTLGGNSITVSSGATLEVTADGVAKAALTSNGTVQGEGTIKGASIINGLLTPTGDEDARLTFGSSLTLSSSATTVLVVSPDAEDGSTNTSVEAESMILGGQLRLVLSGLVSTSSSEWTLFEAGSFSGSFDSVELLGAYTVTLSLSGQIWSGVADGSTWSFDQSTGVLSAEAVPEPSAVFLLLLSICAGLLWRKWHMA